MRRHHAPVWIALAGLLICGEVMEERGARADDESSEFFENSVRPLLVKRCLSCHGPEEQSNGLRLDSRERLLKGGDSGPALVAGDAANSLLLRAVKREGDLQMPPDEALSDREITTLTQWIKLGAPWPDSKTLLTPHSAARAKTHWAFQPISKPAVPGVQSPLKSQNPIDAFVMARRKQLGLAASPEADRRTLIRRVSFTLTGLPPSPEDVANFQNDPDPKAYERLVDRLLNSPHFGEHWARHWLDLARYSDTKGYVYAREERFWVHAWAYRDWVVNALNDDLPYNRFLLLQLAGDQVQDRAPGDLAAMGFLTLGRRFLGVTHDIIDDRIDVVCRGTLGLTVSCARCHDHKYDPIPTADYYSLYGVFNSSAERLVFLGPEPLGDAAYQQELKSRQQKLKATLAESRIEQANRTRERVADYLKAQTELEKYPSEGFDQIFEKTDLLPAFVRRWEAFLREADRKNAPIFRPWHAFRQLPSEHFAEQAMAATERLKQSATGDVNPIILQAFSTSPQSFEDVIERYSKVFSAINAEWLSLLANAKKQKQAPPVKLSDPNAEALRRVLYGPEAPCEVPDLPIVHTENFFDSATCTALWKLQGEVDRWMINSNFKAPYALTLVDRPQPQEPRIFRRGDPAQKGDEVPRRFLSLLAEATQTQQPFEEGSGRLELARAIIHPNNPLTARVIVNRVWSRHFGEGLVTTPSDFGLRADPPSHPLLLDWLATRFMADGWSLKKLHREILLSATFRQSSQGPTDPAQLRRAMQTDPANRLLWRMNPHRLTFEEFRDALLASSNNLDRQSGGKPIDLFKTPFSNRRTLYGLVDRQFLPGTLRVFDFANPDLHVPERNETTVPQQSLFFLNHPFVVGQARELVKNLKSLNKSGKEARLLEEAGLLKQDSPPAEKLRALFQQTYQRNPTPEEQADALAFLRHAEDVQPPAQSLTANDWQYGYGAYDEVQQRVRNFAALPHFTGQTWQGGPNWPDAKLGWVQLTATGGHPGNDRNHAAIRRWTAPRAMTIQLQSKLIHEAAPGDGIRAFLVSSRSGLLQSATIHQKTMELNVDSLPVEAGDTIDFVIDINKILNSDQYRWTASITEPGNDSTTWNSQTDFPTNEVNRLTSWEQLAHVLICSNEFLFVD